MDKAQSDLVEWYKLKTEFFPDHIRHTRYVEKAKTRNQKVKEDWRNCGELGKGGFGVVHKQAQGTTGHYRAVKTINKKKLLPNPNYYRELLVMALLAKRPSLFVEFLGWFEESETLYIAMEYLEGGDLTRYISSPLPQETVQSISKQILEGLKVMHKQGIAHRDLKPANIFVVSMSPVWIKLGDFGVSKRIQAQATTSFMTQVATQIYGAPEVLGLDTYSETSVYTNSVDIWSLGCVIYELLAGTRLFGSWGQVSSYYHGKMPFPEDKLKALSPPTDDVGISLIRSMLAIQPEDRPTAADALGDEWLVGLKSSDQTGGGDQDETTQYRDESIRSRKRGGQSTTHGEPKRRRGQRNPIAQDDPKRALVNAALRANLGSQSDSNLTTSKSEIDTAVITPPHIASVESSLIQKGSMKSESTVDALQLPGDSFQGPQGADEQTDPHHLTNMSPRHPGSDPPKPDPHGEHCPRSTPGENYPLGHTPKLDAPGPIPDAPMTAVAYSSTSE